MCECFILCMCMYVSAYKTACTPVHPQTHMMITEEATKLTHIGLFGQLIKGGEGDLVDAGFVGQEDGAQTGGIGGNHQQHEHPPERRQDPPRHGPRGRRVPWVDKPVLLVFHVDTAGVVIS